MYQHHKETIANITEKLQRQEEILALIIGGSIAHGFETEVSDVDIMIIVSGEEYLRRTQTGQLQYFEREACTYEAGYIDGKYLSLDFLRQVSLKGSEPARFAFEGAWTAFSRISGVDTLLKEVVRYPVERKIENIRRFYAQFEAWKWYCDEALKHQNRYLLYQSVSQLILFAGRLILAHNETLYPYHKWFLKVLSKVQDKPSDLMERISSLLEAPDQERIQGLFQCVKEYRSWETADVNWPNIFMKDSELNWMYGDVPVGDI